MVPGSARRSSRQGTQRESVHESIQGIEKVRTDRENMSIRGNEFPKSALRRDSGSKQGSRTNLMNSRRQSGRRTSQKLGVSILTSDQPEKKPTNTVISPDIITNVTASNTKLQKAQKWSDLDKYIELLLDSKSEEETVFVYLVPHDDKDPYDLKVVDYSDRSDCERYFTLSSKGLTTYVNEKPIEFQQLGQWLIERDSFNHIKELSFFK
jgi:hypothetical protein